MLPHSAWLAIPRWFRQRAGSQLQVFAAFGPDGAGAAGSVSAISIVSQVAVNGVPVSWWAGGPASVPLRGRLASRSLACVRSVVGSGAGSGLVAFISALPSRPWGSVHSLLAVSAPGRRWPLRQSLA